MKTLIHHVISFLLLISPAWAESLEISPEDRAVIDRAAQTRDRQAIVELSEIVERLANSPGMVCLEMSYFQRHFNAVCEAAEVLQTIQGHGEYQKEKILNAAAQFDAASTQEEKNQARKTYEEITWKSLGTLAWINSPEAIRVLGDFLENDKEIPAEEVKGCTAECAAFDLLSISQLENPPAGRVQVLRDEDENGGKERALQRTKNWYQQIKTGRRTFRFSGDPQEYNLTGPAHEARNPDIVRPSRRPRVSKLSTAEPSQSSPSSAPWVAGVVVVLLGVGGWVYLHRTLEK